MSDLDQVLQQCSQIQSLASTLNEWCTVHNRLRVFLEAEVTQRQKTCFICGSMSYYKNLHSSNYMQLLYQ